MRWKEFLSHREKLTYIGGTLFREEGQYRGKFCEFCKTSVETKSQLTERKLGESYSPIPRVIVVL